MTQPRKNAARYAYSLKDRVVLLALLLHGDPEAMSYAGDAHLLSPGRIRTARRRLEPARSPLERGRVDSPWALAF